MTPSQASLLDSLRAAAAQIVLIGHIYSLVLRPGHTLGIGDLGVVVFFVLSGFLIGYTTLNRCSRSDYDLRRYLADRFCRIFVPYLPALVLILLIDSAVFAWTDTRTYIEHYTLQDFVASLLMLQQHPAGLFFDEILGASSLKLSTFSSARPLWTVAVEWWLYLVFGLLVFRARQIVSSRSWQLLFIVCASVPLFNAVAGTGAGLSLVWFVMCGLAWIYWRGRERIDTGIAAIMNGAGPVRGFLRAAPVLLLLLIAARLLWTGLLETRQPFERLLFYDFNLYGLIMALCVVLFLLEGTTTRGGRSRIARFIADYSYSLYLIHYSVIFMLHAFDLTSGSDLLDLLMYLIVCNIAAIMFWYVFERHYRRFGELLAGRHKTVPTRGVP
ncbi:MAG: acyltransferase [Methyloversatilis sp.]|jgi:peptidoglycan/LPS O-acetylase OafA/YrhL|nr:acyltransferase [Methyloversatilis sp.]MBP6193786.1 acyltransferase [Methyloversatilis sp.]MBP9117569.1 acyltransferase [Methyloversatilis sp.]